MLLGLFLILISSCKKDAEVPVVNYFHINHSSDTVEVLFTDTLLFSFEASDNQNLDSYRLNVSNNFGFTTKTNTQFSTVNIGEFLNPLNDSIIITQPLVDSNLAGPYTATLEINDLEGNVTDVIARNFVINRPDAPTINITNLDLNNTITISTTDSIEVLGTLTDDTDLATFSVRITELSSLTTVSEEVFSYNDIETLISLTGDNKVKFAIDDIDLGNYYIFFILKDDVGNVSFKQSNFTIN